MEEDLKLIEQARWKKEEDEEIRRLMLEAAKISLRTGNVGIAKDLLKSSAIIGEKIKNSY